ncbi:MAG: 50S ribosomal protein L10 [Planctomycetes bacterium]|nr:50S ribosomal protein L10 [Planctomycetota bacterium]
MSKTLNNTVIGEYQRDLASLEGGLLISLTGLSGEKDRVLRARFRERGLRVRVVKNRLAREALNRAGRRAIAGLLRGPTAVVYGADEEGAIAAAKLCAELRRDFPTVQVTGGFISGEPVAPDLLKSMKGRLETLSLLAGQITGPGAALAACLAAPGGNIASQVEEVGKKQESGGSPA